MERIEAMMRQGAGLWLALALTLLLALPGFFSLPPVDRDEVLFAQSSAQMLASGDPVDIRFADQVRYKKPVGIYWVQSVLAFLTGQPQAIQSYRLASVLGGLIAVGFTYGMARRVMAPAGACLAAVMLGSCFILGAEMRLAKTDAFLLGSIAAAGFVLARLWLPAGRGQPVALAWPYAVLFWVALAVQVLVKGPIGPLVTLPLLAGLCLLRRDLAILRALRPLRGLALFAALVLPWVIAITIRSDGAFWTASVGEDMLAKVGSAKESHGAPPGSYLLALWLTFWPAAILFGTVLPALWRARRDPLVVFAALWALPFWAVFEATPTKLIHYTMPAYPMLAILAAWAFTTRGAGNRWVARGLALVPFLLLGALAYGAREVGGRLAWTYVAGGLGLVAAVVFLLGSVARARIGAATLALACCGFALSFAFYPTLARMPVLWPAPAIAALARPDCRLVVAGFNEPSLVFLTQNRAIRATADEARAEWAKPGCITAVIESRVAKDYTPDAAPRSTLRGIALGNGRKLELSVFSRP
ncbi:ArnT family glycosyltransferase [Paragemmobacter straminiformis]|uniref:Glycosyltransferase family 39 protein n=1 Tax=Paragemmobacter straminiformis TaxID=2045119 RepID=A0A842I688_9RHOB|nr:glycosyltransferase family 39 protein [Gemmobacter straminiformis]MBC2835360.1 glycosyltransferase family 39 protein [Gemmobacter straminiformis]